MASNPNDFIVPFKVEKLAGMVDHTVITFSARKDRAGKILKDRNGNQKWDMGSETIKEPAGYMVHLARNKGSIRVRTNEELQRLGFDRVPAMVHTPTGQVVPAGFMIPMELEAQHG